jgi:hypothetical protein
VTRSERNDEIAIQGSGDIRRQEQATIRRLREVNDVALDVGGAPNPEGYKLDRE